MNILIAPHSDDESLFASFIIQRVKPHVIIVTDGTTHAEKFNIPIKVRREETKAAMALLGATVSFLGIPEEKLLQSTNFLPYTDGLVFAPAKQGGHPHHDYISDMALFTYGLRVLYYTTYKKDMLVPYGEMPLIGQPDEVSLKLRALDCYKSQHVINTLHFQAVEGTPEYLCFKQIQ